MRTFLRCPLCNKKPVSGLLGLPEYWYCTRCSLAWIKKFRRSRYDEDYYLGRSTYLSNLFVPLEAIFYLMRQWYVKQKSMRLWVDVGAGDGGFLRTVRSKQKIGVEISASGRTMMERRGLTTMSEKVFLGSRNLRADVISFWHVLEHMVNPWEYLAVASKNLSHKGLLVIGVPNLDSIELRLFQRHWFHLVPEHHLWFFSSISIGRMLRKSGFVVQKIDYWSPEHHIPGILQSLINKTSGSDSVLHRLIKRREHVSSLSLLDIAACIFWLTAGLPIVFLFWIVSSLAHKSGTIVVIAQKGVR